MFCVMMMESHFPLFFDVSRNMFPSRRIANLFRDGGSACEAIGNVIPKMLVPIRDIGDPTLLHKGPRWLVLEGALGRRDLRFSSLDVRIGGSTGVRNLLIVASRRLIARYLSAALERLVCCDDQKCSLSLTLDTSVEMYN